MSKIINITQIRSSIGCLPKHKLTLLGLGLRRIGSTAQLLDTFAVRGMLHSVFYNMIGVE